MANENFRVKNGLEVGGVLVVNSSGAIVANVNSNTVTLTTLIANNTTGGLGDVLFSNGTVAYWSPSGALTTNVNDSYTWTNTHTFANNVTFEKAVTFGNSTVNSVINSTSVTTTNLSGNGANITSVDAASVGGNTASTLRTYSETKAGEAYSNATTFASNADNISSGTLNTARLPGTIAISTAIDIGNSTVNTFINSSSISTSNVTVAGDLVVSGNVFFNGTTTNVNSTNLVVEDKNIILGDVDTPSDVTADGGGITLKGATDKTLTWVDSTDTWTSSEDFNLASGKQYEINGTQVINSTALGSGIVGSSLTSVGTLTGLAVDGTVTVGNSTVNSIVNSTAVAVKSIVANGGTGAAGDILFSNGSAAYWSPSGSVSVNLNAQYAWTNVHTFFSYISVGNSTVNSIVNTTHVSTTNLSGNGASITSVDAASVGGNTAATLRTYSETKAGEAYSNATTFASNASNITSGTLTSSRLPATVNVTSEVYVGSNVSITTSTINVGNSTVNTTVNSSSVSTGSLAATNLSGNGALITSVDAATVGGNTASTLRTYSETKAGEAYSNATAFASNADNISSGTLNTARLPAVVNVATAVNVGANVNVNTSVLQIGNSTVNTTINSSVITTTNVVATNLSGNGASITSVDAATVGGNTASTLRSYSETKAGEAYSNAVSYADTKAGQAYTNATSFASNADNISSGTLNTARLPATVNVSTAVNVGANVNLTTASVTVGNSTVNTAINSTAVAVKSIVANGSVGTAGDVLFSNGTVSYWAPSGALTTNVDATYVWTNNHTFSKNVTVNGAFTVSNTAALGNTTVTDVLTVGNSTVNSVINSSAITITNVNAVAVAVGANVNVTTSSITVGNSTVNAALTSTSFDIDGTINSGNVTVTGDLVVSGNVFFNGTTTNVNSTNLVVEDKNIIIGDVTTPSDVTADGGGITLKGATDKTLTWVDSTDAWTSSEDFNLLAGKQYEINGTQVINSTALGTGVTGSSLTSVGTLTGLTVSGATTLQNTLSAGNTTVNNVLTVGNSTVNTSITPTIVTTTNVVATNLSGNGALVTSVDAISVGGNSASTLRTYSETKAGEAYSNAVSYSDTKAGQAYTNATSFASNADNISSGTLNTARLPATVNVATAVNVGANVNLTTSSINVGNSTVNTAINSTAVAVKSIVANGGVGAAGDVLFSNGSVAYWAPSGALTTNVDAAFAWNNTHSFSKNVTVNGAFTVANTASLGNTTVTEVLTIGNSTVNTVINSSSVTATKLSGNGATITSVDAATVGGNTAATLRSYSDTVAATAFSNAAARADSAYSNATVYASNADNITSGTLNTARLPATVNVATAINVGANVNANTSALQIGNSTVNTSVNSSVISTTNVVATNLSGNGSGITSVDAATVGGNTAATLRSYSDTKAGEAYSNATVYASNADNISSGTLNTARLPATVNVATAVNIGANVNANTSALQIGNSTVNTVVTSSSVTTTNVVATNLSGNGALVTSVDAATVGGNTAATLRSYTDTKAAEAYSNAVNASGSAAQAYTNAIAYAANADNISSGTLNTARLPATVNVSTAINVGANVNVNTSVLQIGNSTVNTVITANSISTGSLTVSANIVMNNKNITGLAEPVNASDAATKAYVDGFAEGLHTHDTCNAATTDTLATLSGGTVTYDNGTSGVGAKLTTTGSYTTIDGVTLSNGSRILVKNEANTAHNGIYERSNTTVLTRATDFDAPAEMAGGDFTFVTGGTLYDSTGWVMSDAVATVGTSAVSWTQFSGAGTYTAGAYLYLNGTIFTANANTQAQASVLVARDASGGIAANNVSAVTGTFTGAVSGITTLGAGNTTITGFANVSGNVYVGNSTVFWTANSTEIDVGNVTVNTTVVAVGANVVANTSGLLIGNSTVNTTVNSSVVTTTNVVATNLSGNGALITSVTASTLNGNTAADLRSYSDTVAATAFSNAAARADSAYSNATAFAANADNISSGTLNTARLPATVNVSTAINVGANVNLSTSQINVGNSTVNTVITSTSISGNGANITSVNAATVGGNTAATLRSYSDTVAATAFSNAAARADSAYSNATAFAANADNISSGTLNNSRLPTSITGKNTFGTLSVEVTNNAITLGSNVSVNTSALQIGNSTVNTVVNSSTIAVRSIFANGGIGAAGDVLFSNGTVSYWAPSGALTTNVNAQFVWTNTHVFQNTVTLQSNLVVGNSTVAWTANSTTANIGNVSANTTAIAVGANVIANTSALFIGNSTVNSLLTATSLDVDGVVNVGNTSVTGFVNASVSVNSALITVGTSLIGNTTGLYHTGVVNAASHTTTGTTANATGVYPASNSSGTALGAAANRWILNANTVDASGLATLSGGVNTTTANASVAVNVGANVNVNTSTLQIGNSTVNTVINSSSVSTGTVSVGNATVTGDLVVSGNVFFNGTTTNVNSTNLVVEDKNIIIGDVATPTDVTADGGGITLKGATDKTLNWVDATDAWTSSEDFNLVAGKQYEINGAQVINSTALGTGITGSSLTSVGTLTALTVSGLAALNGAMNTTTANASVALNVGANVTANTTALFVGNSTVNTVVNSTAIAVRSIQANGGIGAAGDILFSNGTGSYWAPSGAISVNVNAQYVWTNTHTFQNTVTLQSNVTFGNSTVSWTANSTTINVGTSTVNTTVIAAGANVIANTTAFGVGNSTVNAVHTATGLVVASGATVNTSGVYPNSNTVATALGTATQRWVLNANTIDASGLITGGAGATITGTANASVAINVGANVNLTTTSVGVGNSTVNSVLNSTALTIASGIIANTSGVYPNSNSVGTALGSATQRWILTANTGTFSGAVSGITTLAAGNTTITGFVNATVSVNSAIITTGNVSANQSGVYPNSNTVGTALGAAAQRWILNANTIDASGLITGGAGLTITGTANVSTLLNIGANVFANTSTLFVGNSSVNTVITAGNIALNGSQLTVGNTTVLTTLTGDILTVGNSTVNTVINSTSISAAKLIANGASGAQDQVMYANSTGGVYWRTPATITNVEPSTVGATSNGHVWYVYV